MTKKALFALAVLVLVAMGSVGTAVAGSGLPAVGIASWDIVNRWGSDTADLQRELAGYGSIHATWTRTDFRWDVIEPQQGVFRWSAYDQYVSQARQRGLSVIATIDYTPAWANGGHADNTYQPSSSSQFGQFAGKVAKRYARQGVHVYEIWNEPNIDAFWKPVPSPQAYAQDLAAAYRNIKAADSQATVITGGSSPAGTGPTSYSPVDWLSALYGQGAKPYFDGVGHHPYVDSTPTPGDLGGNWYLMGDPSYPYTTLRQVMSSNGDSAKRVWATEAGCNRLNLGDAECATRISEALQAWRGYPWAAALGWFTYFDPNAYGLVDGSWNLRSEGLAYQSAAGGF